MLSLNGEEVGCVWERDVIINDNFKESVFELIRELESMLFIKFNTQPLKESYFIEANIVKSYLLYNLWEFTRTEDVVSCGTGGNINGGIEVFHTVHRETLKAIRPLVSDKQYLDKFDEALKNRKNWLYIP